MQIQNEIKFNIMSQYATEVSEIIQTIKYQIQQPVP